MLLSTMSNLRQKYNENGVTVHVFLIDQAVILKIVNLFIYSRC